MCSFNRNPGDSSFMLRLGRHYPGKKTWGPAHMNCLMLQKLEHREQRIALEELLGAVRQESERVERLEQAIRDAVPEWSLAEVVTALQAMRGIDLVAAGRCRSREHGRQDTRQST
jgi:transposase